MVETDKPPMTMAHALCMLDN